MADLNRIKETIFQRLTPAMVFSDLDPYRDAGKFVCVCPQCGEQTLISEPGSVHGRCAGQTCTYTTTFWDYIKKKEKLDDRETLERLAQIAGVYLSGQKTLTDVYRLFFEVGQACLMSSTEAAVHARAFLQDQGFTMDNIKDFGFCIHPGDPFLARLIKKNGIPDILLKKSGLADISDSDKKLLLPLKDEAAIITGFVLFPITAGGDDHRDTYIHNFSKGSHLFSVNMAFRKIRMTETALIASNALEVCCLHSLGFTNALSLDGDTIFDIHIDYLQKFGAREVLFCDTAPIHFTKHSAINLFKRGFLVSKVALPGSISATEYLEANGESDFNKMIKKAEPIWEWMASAIVTDLRDTYQHVSENVLRDKAVIKSEEIVSLLRESDYLQNFLYRLSAETRISVSNLKKKFKIEAGRDEAKRTKEKLLEKKPECSEIEGDLQLLMNHFMDDMRGYLNDYRIDIIQDRAVQLLYGYAFPKNKEGSLYKEYLKAVIDRTKKLDYRGIDNLLCLMKKPSKNGTGDGTERY